MEIALPFGSAAEQCIANKAGEAFIWNVEECCWGSALKHIMKTCIWYHCASSQKQLREQTGPQQEKKNESRRLVL
jgi:hypothetical protein